MADFGNAAMQGFRTGFESQGPSTMGVFVTNLMDRMNKLQELRAKSQADVYTSQQSQLVQIPGKVQEAGLTEQAKAKAEMDVYKPFLSQGTGQGATSSGFQVSKIQAGPFTLENPAYENQQKLAGATATNQAEVRDAAMEGVRTVSQLRGMLQVNSQARTIGNRAAITRSGVPGAFLSQENPDERDLRSSQGKLHNFIALVRTGRQGLEQQIPFVQEQYNLGYTDLDENIVNRLDQAEQELISRAGLTPDEVEQLRQEGLLNEYRRRGIQ